MKGETPTEARLPTKLRQKIQRRSEYVEMNSTTSTATNMNNKFLPHGQAAPSSNNDPASATLQQSSPLTLLHVDLHRGLHAAPLLTGVPPGSSFVNVQALVPFHQALLPSAPPLQCTVAGLSPVACPPQPAHFPKPERASADDLAPAPTPTGSSSNQDRVERRLAQNREAARKCRQKKKAYLSRLEAEVQALKTKTVRGGENPLAASSSKDDSGDTKPAAALPAATCGYGSASDGAGSGEQQQQQQQQQEGGADLTHLRSRLDRAVWEALRLRDALSSQAPEGTLRAQVDALVERLKELHRDKEKALRTASLLLIMAGEHFHPPQRVLLWMGGLRPTEGLRLVLDELRTGQLPPGLQEQLQRIMEDCYQQEEALARAYMVLKADILTHLSHRNRAQHQQPWLTPHAGAALKPPPLPTLTMRNNRNSSTSTSPSAAARASSSAPAATDPLALSPMLLGKLSAMRVLMAEAEDLRMNMLAELHKVLTLPQFAVVLIRPLELLHALNSTSASLQALQADGRLIL